MCSQSLPKRAARNNETISPMPNENHSDDFIQPLPVYVINLAHDRKRWEAIAHSAKIHAPQLAIHRIEAIDGKAIEAVNKEGVDLAAFNRLCGRDMLPGEYGCYRSHLKALEAFVTDGAPYGLILEDDIAFDAESAPRIQAVIAALPDLGIIKLVNHRRPLMIDFADTTRGDSIGRTLHGPQGSAAAYLVSRLGARRLLDALATMTLPWDVAIERFWSHGVSVLTTDTDSLSFNEGRKASNIVSASRDYDSVKYPWYRRLKASIWRTADHIRRIYHVLKLPAHPFPYTGTVARTDAPTHSLPLWGEVIAGIAILVFVSAVWQESDAYRYVGMVLIFAALIRYVRVDFWDYRIKPYIGWAGTMCIVWAAYVAVRFLYSQIFYPELGRGTAEGVYLLPLFYPTTGYALFLYARRPFVLAAMFMAISMLVFAFGIDFNFQTAIRARTLLHNNPIHASVAAGFIALCAIPFALHVANRGDLKPSIRVLLEGLAGITFVIALLAIYNLRSKGVWLAMIVSLPILAAIIVATEENRYGRKLVTAALVITFAGATLNYEMLHDTAAATVDTSILLLQDTFAGKGIVSSMEGLIADASIPHSANERMMLWVSALNIWEANPIFGAGISWLHEWQNRPYQQVPYNILHNGYLEIAVRYGIIGLAFYAILLGWGVRKVWLANRTCLIDRTALQCYIATMTYFAVTLLSNSNNRLAIGESYMWLAAGFGFYCHFLLQRHQRCSSCTLGAPRD